MRAKVTVDGIELSAEQVKRAWEDLHTPEPKWIPTNGTLVNAYLVGTPKPAFKNLIRVYPRSVLNYGQDNLWFVVTTTGQLLDFGPTGARYTFKRVE